MKVEYRTKKLKKQCEDPKTAKKDYGSNIGNKLTQRVGELIAATSLLDIKYIPSARLHRLKGKRADEYAVDLVHPYRLVFTPILKEGGDINELESINIVRIEEVKDYHGKQKR
ncbi:MAG: type II toxin-antitoxin system RelE/ParE family toxin [Xylanivirga thermophila]|jgi:toxin HigB-1|uniref:type II toxin-antitoxin system RelE/ParE family toxin n=1 Tax=Xylanivirga thermophila TaxID=2496273 RepID=UPI0039F58522